MAHDVRTLSAISLRVLLALMASDTASPLTQGQRDTLWRRLGKAQQPMWTPTVDDCGVEPMVLQQWFRRCNRDLRIYVTKPLYGERDSEHTGAATDALQEV